MCTYDNRGTGVGSKIEKILYCLNLGLEFKRRVIFKEFQTTSFVDPYFERIWDPCGDEEFNNYHELPAFKGEDFPGNFQTLSD